METKVIEALAEALAPVMEKQKADRFGIGQKHDASGFPQGFGYIHGPGGVLSFPGVDQSVFHTVVGNLGILSQLPTKASPYTDPTFAVLTGVQDISGNEKNLVCEDAPVAGLKKVCLITSVFGRYERATPELELNRLGKLNDRADPIDLTLVGSPIHQSGVFAAGPGSPAMPADILKNEITQKFWELGIAFHRLLSVQLWQGNPANNSAGGGYMEMTGFDRLISTGYIDAQNGARCASIDSDLKDFSYGRIDLATVGVRIVDFVSSMYHFLKDKAERQGVMPVRWVFVMRPTLFWELTAVWPCSYLTYRCQTAANQMVTIEATHQVEFRDAMRAGRYLLVDGEKIEVILDDGIDEDADIDNANVPAGCFSSDLYLVPMSVVGGRAVTYLEYADYANPSLSAALAGSNMILARVDGAFLVWPRQKNQCIEFQAKIEPRLVMRTPWLAGRIQNVLYCPLQHEAEPFPSDPYFVDGGPKTRPGPSYYSLWQPSQQMP